MWQKLLGPHAARPRVIAFALRSDGGELHIGKIDDTVYDGMQKYECDPSSPFWAIKGASIQVGQEKVEEQKMIFDTASQFIRGPPSQVQKLYNKIGLGRHVKFDAELGLYEIPCDSDTSVSIRLILGHERPEWVIDPQL
jgi:hypothetical protein